MMTGIPIIDLRRKVELQENIHRQLEQINWI